MSFWLIKARRTRTDLATVVVPSRRAIWRTKRPPAAWKPGDGVFLWQSSPDLELRGLGTITDIPGRNRQGETRFEVEYTDAFDGPGIAALRKLRPLADASFLKRGAAGTVFPLKAAEATALTHALRPHTDTLDDWQQQVIAGDHPDMAISIRQPYVEQIFRGDKTAEYRSRPTKRRGRVLIYAALKPAPPAAWQRAALEPGTLPTGLVLGTVDIMTCTTDRKHGYAYQLSNPTRFDAPRKPVGHPQPTWFRAFPE